MRLALLSAVLLATLAAVVVACGGSSSETPWPVEPEPAVIAPGIQAPSMVIEDDAGPGRK